MKMKRIEKQNHCYCFRLEVTVLQTLKLTNVRTYITAVQCFIDEDLGSFEFEMLMPQLQFYRLNILRNGTMRQIKERKSKIIVIALDWK